mgnify:CR=1 FL=1
MLECGLAPEDADEDLLGGPDAPPYLPGSANHGVLIAFFGCMPSALCGLQACGAQTCGNCGDDDCAAGDRVTVTTEDDGLGWVEVVREADGAKGLVPLSYLTAE